MSTMSTAAEDSNAIHAQTHQHLHNDNAKDNNMTTIYSYSSSLPCGPCASTNTSAWQVFAPQARAFLLDLPCRFQRQPPTDLSNMFEQLPQPPNTQEEPLSERVPFVAPPPELRYWMQLTTASALTGGLMFGLGELPKAALTFTGNYLVNDLLIRYSYRLFFSLNYLKI